MRNENFDSGDEQGQEGNRGEPVADANRRRVPRGEYDAGLRGCGRSRAPNGIGHLCDCTSWRARREADAESSYAGPLVNTFTKKMFLTALGH